jgi:hypothetical protein
MNSPDHISESLETIFWVQKILKFFDADPGSGIEKIRIRYPRWGKFGSEIRNIGEEMNILFFCDGTENQIAAVCKSSAG